ncbi:MAG: MoxR family ATPase [Pseudomonadota bacterium]
MAQSQQIDPTLASLGRVRQSVAQVIVGQNSVVDDLLIALLAGGHCLLEGVPGLGKTLLMRTLGVALDLPFGRIQFTPDLMPADIVGSELLVEGDDGRRFEFQPGPVFHSLLLADEINRTPPRTQAALLEATGEGSVTWGGKRHELPQPFFVMATQNPLEQAGTYPLPEAQLDRFLLQVRMDYPSFDAEVEILERTTGAKTSAAEPVMDKDAVLLARSLVREVPISSELVRYAAQLIRATRPECETAPSAVREWVRWGAGPRAGQALIVCAKARAILNGRLSVTLADLHAVAPSVLRHRLILNYHAQTEHHGADDVVDDLLTALPEPADPLPSVVDGSSQ